MNSLAFNSLLCSGVFIDQAQAQLQQQIRYDRRVWRGPKSWMWSA